MWDAKVLINDHLTIKHNLSMYTETFKGKLAFSQIPIGTSREMIKNGHEVRLPVRRPITQHYLTPLSGRQLKDSKLIPFSVIFVTQSSIIATVAFYAAFFGLWYFPYLYESNTWIYVMRQTIFAISPDCKKIRFKNYIKIMGKSAFTNKEIKIEDTWQCIDSCAYVRLKGFSKSQVKQGCCKPRGVGVLTHQEMSGYNTCFKS